MIRPNIILRVRDVNLLILILLVDAEIVLPDAHGPDDICLRWVTLLLEVLRDGHKVLQE